MMEAHDPKADIVWYDATQFRFLLPVNGRTVQACILFGRSRLLRSKNMSKAKGMIAVSEWLAPNEMVVPHKCIKLTQVPCIELRHSMTALYVSLPYSVALGEGRHVV